MERTNRGFWRNFTWKKLGKYSLLIFLFTFVVGIGVNYFDPSDTVRNLFTVKEVVQRLISALFTGFLFALWIEPKQ